MSKLSRTISFLRRNGMTETFWAVMERMGKWYPDPDQMAANRYVGKAVDDICSKEQVRENYKFSIVVPAYETDKVYLCEMIDSVVSQTYGKWQLVIADASQSNCVKDAVADYEDGRICYVKLEKNEGISQNTNAALVHADGDYIGLLDHDDTLHPQALAEMAKMLEKNAYEMIYTDEDKISHDGSLRFEPNFKPDFNFDFLLSNNYICHFTVLSRRLMERISFRPAYDGAQDYDLFLQAVFEIEKMHKEECGNSILNPQTQATETYIPYEPAYMKAKIGHVSRILYHWRANASSTADNPESKRYAYEAGKRALEEFARCNGWDVTVSDTKHLGFYDVTYHPDIFAVRKDVSAVCGKVVKGNRITEGPRWGNRMLFDGMNARYSGYMHRAVLKLSVDAYPAGCVKTRETTGVSEDINTRGRFVYLPDFVVRK